MKSQSISRRRFGQKIGKISLATLTTSAVVATLTRCSKAENSSQKTAGETGNDTSVVIQLNEHRELGQAGGFKALKVKDTPVIIIHREENVFQTFSLQCTHKGCKLSWKTESQHFICPCHGSKFDRLGKVVSGPADTALTEYKTVYKEDGSLVIEI